MAAVGLDDSADLFLVGGGESCPAPAVNMGIHQAGGEDPVDVHDIPLLDGSARRFALHSAGDCPRRPPRSSLDR